LHTPAEDDVDPRLALIGLLVGLLVGLSGVGGSSIMTPLLILVLGVKPLVAVGTDLAYSVPTKLLGAFVHRRQGTVDRRVVLCLSLGGIPASVLGLVVMAALRAHLGLSRLNMMLKHGVGLLLFLVAVGILLNPLLSRHQEQGRMQYAPTVMTWTRMTTGRIIALGALVGFLVSLTSIGSGSITVPLLYVLMPRLGLRRLVGSDVAFAALLMPAAALGQLQMGNVNVALSANLLLGSLPGVFIGSKLCARLPEFWLRPALAGVLLLAGCRLV
jgi:uncharacterized membrane protein YfcA